MLSRFLQRSTGSVSTARANPATTLSASATAASSFSTSPRAEAIESGTGIVACHEGIRAISGGDALGGAQLLLLEASRGTIEGVYRDAFNRGALAVVTSVNTSWPHLDRNLLYVDGSRENDLTYYVPGQGMMLQEDRKAGGIGAHFWWVIS